MSVAGPSHNPSTPLLTRGRLAIPCPAGTSRIRLAAIAWPRRELETPQVGGVKSDAVDHASPMLWNRDGTLNLRELGVRSIQFVAVTGFCVAVGVLVSSLG